MQQLIRNQNKKREEKIKDLQELHPARFSANKSKSRAGHQPQKGARLHHSWRRCPPPAASTPIVGFEPEREAGKDILFVDGISKTMDGVKVLDNVTFTVNKGDKIAFVGDNEAGATALFQHSGGRAQPRRGQLPLGRDDLPELFPQGQHALLPRILTARSSNGCSQFSHDTTETYLRGFLGRMLFSGDDVYKPAKVLSGGEKVRCMLSRLMMSKANALILDQPTDHLDLESITALSNGLQRLSRQPVLRLARPSVH